MKSKKCGTIINEYFSSGVYKFHLPIVHSIWKTNTEEKRYPCFYY